VGDGMTKNFKAMTLRAAVNENLAILDDCYK
jgi:hypothetical protein